MMSKILVGKLDELDKVTHIESEGNDILLVRLDNNIYALSNICTHAGASLHEGKIEDNRLICPWHSAIWDITTGDLIKFPAKLRSLRQYKVSIEEGYVYLEL